MFNFFFLIFLVAFYLVVILKDTRGITFLTPSISTDDEKMLVTADQYANRGFINWPGIVHYLYEGKGRAELREFWIIFISFIQRCSFKKSKFSHHVNVTAGIISQGISTLLIYFLSSYFVPNYIALLISIIYLSQIWCTQVILWLGHIIFSQVFFLISIGFLLFAYINQGNDLIFNSLILISGISNTLCFTASSASRKFPPIIIFLQLFICLNIFSGTNETLIINSLGLVVLALVSSPILFKYI